MPVAAANRRANVRRHVGARSQLRHGQRLVVRQEHGAAVANAIARRMIVPGYQPGGQAQYIEAPLPADTGGPVPADLLQWARERPHAARRTR